MSKKTAILLVNLGTPDSPSRKHVRKFISEFLNDARVIDIPYILRKILVNLIIVPFRTSKSTILYQKLWMEKGSPILYFGNSMKDKLSHKVDQNHSVFLAMRYGNPGVKNVLRDVQNGHFHKITILPLFPQYASSTTGSIINKMMNIIQKWNYIPEIEIISSFYKHPSFIDSWIERINKYDLNDFDHILFSYHGLPLRHVEKTHHNKSCKEFHCENEINQENHSCYYAQCFETTRLITNQLKLSKDRYTVCFQSRFGKKWLSPFTEEIITLEANKGSKNLLVIPAAFVADCLETIVEISMDYQELFKECGGQNLQMIESLNDNDTWVSSINKIIALQ